MKRNLLTVLAVTGIVLGGFAVAWGEMDGGHGRHGDRQGFNVMERMTESLNLTPEQKAKIQPIVDQAKPQIMAIHQEAMQKTHAVMENAMTQIRPLLNPEQQKKADELRKAHEDMRKAMKEMHDAHNK
ncbi:MAG: periplasmic heavy metal sensor [Spartobacteria bacterium]